MHTRASNSELVKPLPERILNRRRRRRNRRVPFDERNNPPKNPRIVYLPILNINHFCHFLDTFENLFPMDDEPMWAADRVVAPTPGSAIIILETTNEFAIKDNIIKIFYHGLSKITQDILNAASGGIFLYKTPNQAYQLFEDKQSTNAFVNQTFMDLKTQFETVAKNHQASIQNLETKFDRLADKQSGRPSRSLPSNTQPNLKGHNSKAYQPPQSHNERVNAVFTRSEEDFNALLDEGNKILHSIEGTLLEEKIFAEFDEFMTMTADENTDSESDTKDAPFEKITINNNYKIKTSLEEPLTDIELKPLPDNLEYVFLEEPSFLPVIISSHLSKEKKSKLISVFKKHKKAFTWKTIDIPGICPSFCKHKIQLLDDKKPVVQKQRRLNPNIQEVVKKEIMGG
ncbi:hypothetical protein Tco_0804466, partial [Tanacetum coccineum]